MMKHVYKSIVKTMEDNAKDARMQIAYAEDAEEAGDHELSAMHKQEAEERIHDMKRWCETAREKFGNIELGEILIDHFQAQTEELERHIRRL
ncbi:MAG: hypothetical protein ACI3XQ_11455 [Eubacteriales bacterium]